MPRADAHASAFASAPLSSMPTNLLALRPFSFPASTRNQPPVSAKDRLLLTASYPLNVTPGDAPNPQRLGTTASSSTRRSASGPLPAHAPPCAMPADAAQHSRSSGTSMHRAAAAVGACVMRCCPDARFTTASMPADAADAVAAGALAAVRRRPRGGGDVAGTLIASRCMAERSVATQHSGSSCCRFVATVPTPRAQARPSRRAEDAAPRERAASLQGVRRRPGSSCRAPAVARWDGKGQTGSDQPSVCASLAARRQKHQLGSEQQGTARRWGGGGRQSFFRGARLNDSFGRPPLCYADSKCKLRGRSDHHRCIPTESAGCTRGRRAPRGIASCCEADAPVEAASAARPETGFCAAPSVPARGVWRGGSCSEAARQPMHPRSYPLERKRRRWLRHPHAAICVTGRSGPARREARAARSRARATAAAAAARSEGAIALPVEWLQDGVEADVGGQGLSLGGSGTG
eukprot:353549-Chlamydomonas_euryale.AAC.1